MVVLKFIDRHPIIAIAIAWLIYRLAACNERKNILKSLRAELDIQKNWLGTPWSKERASELTNVGHFVYKIATTSVDNAIVRGATLLLNRDLMKSLVSYRQTLDSLNQLIDASRSFQSNVELWDTSKINEDVKSRMLKLIQIIHSEGIGDDNNKDAAHFAFKDLEKQIQREENSKILLIFWLFTNINLFSLKELICK